MGLTFRSLINAALHQILLFSGDLGFLLPLDLSLKPKCALLLDHWLHLALPGPVGHSPKNHACDHDDERELQDGDRDR